VMKTRGFIHTDTTDTGAYFWKTYLPEGVWFYFDALRFGTGDASE